MFPYIRSSEIFKRSLALGLISKPEETEEIFQLPPDTPIKETLLHVSGMWCSACSWLIEHSLKKERGIVSAEAIRCGSIKSNTKLRDRMSFIRSAN